MPGIAFPPSNFGNYNVEHQHTKFGNQWAVHEFSLGNDQWTDEIVALKTEFIIQTDTKYTDLDTSRLLRNFMKFVLRTSARAIWLIVGLQFPQSYLQKYQGSHHLCWHREEHFERFLAVPGVNS